MSEIGHDEQSILKHLIQKHGAFPGTHEPTTMLLPLFDNDKNRTTVAINQLLNADYITRNSTGDTIAITRDGIDYLDSIKP
jgi:hypothetical protein